MRVPALFNRASFARYAHWGFFLYCNVAALSIALSQIFLLPILAYWILVLLFERKTPGGAFVSGYGVVTPLVLWLLIAAVSSLVGINPAHSLPEAFKTAFYFCTPFALACSLRWANLSKKQLLARAKLYLCALVGSQTIAAIHTFASTVANRDLAPKIPGAVTESGQLVLIIPAVIAIICITQTQTTKKKVKLSRIFLSPLVFGMLLFLAGLIFAWPDAIPLIGVYKNSARIVAAAVLTVLATTVFAALLLRYRAQSANNNAANKELLFSQLRTGIAAILSLALLFNLKRGPWLGCFVELSLLGIFLSRRLILVALLLGTLLLFVLAPARNRAFDFINDFSISGGRQEMWGMGSELLQRFPLGLGLNNASYIRELDPSLPELHRHMHNNLLNIAVETGWIGLIAYLWWMYALIVLGISLWRKNHRSDSEEQRRGAMLALCLSAAILGWQIAGLVEYNFGDVEVLLIALLFMGLLFAIAESSAAAAEDSTSQ